MTRGRDSERTLRAEEKRLWGRVTATVKPRHGELSTPDMERFVETSHGVPSDPRKPALRAHPAAPPPGPRVSQKSTLPHDRSSERRVKRGRIDVEASLDLHGMTADKAVRALQRFIETRARNGERCVLVITGKGGIAADGGYAGILHRSFPLWLERDDIRPFLSGYAPSHTRHGGAGAWYVFLKPADRFGLPFR